MAKTKAPPKRKPRKAEATKKAKDKATKPKPKAKPKAAPRKERAKGAPRKDKTHAGDKPRPKFKPSVIRGLYATYRDPRGNEHVREAAAAKLRDAGFNPDAPSGTDYCEQCYEPFGGCVHTRVVSDGSAETKAEAPRDKQGRRDDEREEEPPSFHTRWKHSAVPPDWNPEDHYHAPLTPKDREILKAIRRQELQARDYFELLAAGAERAFIMSGPAGWGKSHLGKSVFDAMGEEYYEINARLTAYVFYQVLWSCRHEDSPVIFCDDAEDLVYERHGVDLAKQASHRTHRRRMSWHTGAAPLVKLNPDDLTAAEFNRFVDPDTGKLPKAVKLPWFDFYGRIAVIVNANLRELADTQKKLRLHSLLDCAPNLTIRTYQPRERMLRIAKVVAEEGMLYKLGLSREQEKEVMVWLWDNYANFWQLTLRSLEKAANYRLHLPERWQELARDEFNYAAGTSGPPPAGGARGGPRRRRGKKRFRRVA